MSIKVKFLLFNTALTILIASGLGLLFVVSTHRLLNQEVERHGLDIARNLAEKAQTDQSLLSESSILPTIQELTGANEILSAYVTNAQGVVIAHSDILKVGQLRPVQKNEGFQYVLDHGAPCIEVTVPLFAAQAQEESFLLDQPKSHSFLGVARTRISLQRTQMMIRKMTWVMAVCVAGAISGAMVLVFIVLNWLLSPLRALKKGVDRVGAGEMDHRVEVSSNDEIADLSLSFNLMTEKLRLTLSDLQVSKETVEKLNENLEQKVRARTKELEEAQLKLVQSEKMSAVGQLAAGVAHEINNPLGVIMGFAQGLVQRLKPGDSLELPFKSIEREAIRCKNLVQDLLTFSRASAANEREPLDLNRVLEGTVHLLETRTKMADVEIRMEFAENLPRVLGNQNQIQQILINLANNAVDAMPQGGTLTVRTELAADSPLSWICLRVIDSGTGIPPAIQPKIFDPFFTTKPVGKGTGLGLSLVYEIVQKHSGTVEVRSQPGRTEFCIRLPARTGRELEARLEEIRKRPQAQSLESEMTRYARGKFNGK